MYRATAEKISGIFVYAGGKWLRCIGNKRVSVGDLIWTDGRCIYGNKLEAQQPLVITAPQEDEEGIPILTAGGTLYTFQKNKLKRVAKIKSESGKINLYKDVAGELEFVNEMPDTDKWTGFSLMINDYRKTAFLYDKGTHFKSFFYGTTPILGTERDFYTDTKLIASNIDKSGNRFDMVIRYKNEWIENDGKRHKEIQVNAVEILRNGKIVKSVDVQRIADEILNACPDAEQVWEFEPFNAYWLTFDYEISNGAFIEDEQTWCFWIFGTCTKATEFNDDPDEFEMNKWHKLSNFESNHLKRIYLIKPDGYSVVAETSCRYEWGHSPDTPVPTNIIKNSYSVTFPIQDGYYCVAKNWQDGKDIFSDDGGDTTIPYRNIAHVTFHSPRNEELFTGTFLMPISFPFCRVKGKYLLSVNSSVFTDDIDKDEVDGVRVFNSGLYFGSETQLENISPGTILINQRLRPMKKIRGWQNRIKLIELNQHEI